jgi:hypothetical protein
MLRKRCSRMRNRLIAVQLVACVASTLALAPARATAAQQALREIGTLTCSLEAEAGGSPGEKAKGRASLCKFRPGDSGAEETYSATLQFISPASGEPAIAGTVILTVKAPFSAELGPGVLEQAYAADASTPAGNQVPLVGQTNDLLVLQPEPGRTGPSLALGPATPATLIAADLKLRESPA